MINLMPTEDQRQLAAARTNSLLLRYAILLTIFIGILALEIGGMYLLINTEKAQNESIISDNTAKTASYTSVKQQANQFNSDLATAKYILDKQVPYTTLILAVANGLPGGAVLDRLAIDPNSFGTPTTITVKTVSYDRSIEVKSALQAMKVNNIPLFSSVSFESVSSAAGDGSYPFTAIYNVTYSRVVLAQ